MGKFLKRVSLDEARNAAIASTKATAAEECAAEESLGRITAAPVFAKFAAPHYRASAMDGIAVIADRVSSASEDAPLTLVEIDPASEPVADPCCAPVDTGTTMPEWADAVIRIENTKRGVGTYTIDAPVPPGRDVRRIGEDVDDDALLFGTGHRIRPYDIGAMLATGIESVSVRRKPRVAMLATGTEVVEPGKPPEPGKVIEYNSRVMAGYITEWGGLPVYRGRVADDKDKLAEAILSAAADCDIACVIAGSSAGRKDFTVDVIQENGELLVHGVDMMPGKPASVAVVSGTPVIGIPGYPVSAVVAYHQLLAPSIATALGVALPAAQRVPAQVRRKIASRLGVEEFIRVGLTLDGDQRIVSPLPRGAGSITTLVRADGILRIPATSEGVEAGREVEIELLGDAVALEDSIVVAGAPDRTCTALEESLRRNLATAGFTHIALSPFDAFAGMGRGEIDVAVQHSTDASDAAGIESMLSECGAAERAWRLHAREGGAITTIVVSRQVAARRVGRELARVLDGNSFGLELETVEPFVGGVKVRHLDVG